ncbi:MAG: Orotidine 5'-phosphate decarboxylase [Ktedonobacterales bacterium]|jgi:orotidine-5'-phosphate decarboxylase|nr:MAG: Orotidine 5'-phosphate decarboxylase [Ktedonobacterales bacterium]
MDVNGHTDGSSSAFMERLRARWRDADALLCVGLDPEFERLPAAVRAGGDTDEHIEAAIVAFNIAIIDATADLVCAFKPNAAFYEAHGLAGQRALLRTIAHIHERHPDVPVLLDAKRGDIGSTSQAYAHAIFDVYGADAVTLHPYLGREALAPFLERSERGAFILCRTSNPGAGEFQDLPVPRDDGSTEPLYLALARRVANEWNARGNCGLVVGATYPDELRRVRGVAGNIPILVPGIGAQGGDLEGTVRAGLDSQRAGLLISSSRGILYASSGDDFAAAARREALRLQTAINELRHAAQGASA